ncbi:DUF5960 family protein [Candidatus Enterococcus courvalinii]|uniref:Uncharacterized protein n=1 Tax=Candidatus Enterococcus courvalinii TaxID=2815329 RepID=A0ABS3I0X5_9ENTE|nr:DUF5960 family protein [Enterococcus sp. MSG2901]MBO0482366.1 hypothetical protein [Enterococcus sp. MSG2901]
MEKEYFNQQEAFLKDYQKFAKQNDVMIDQLADQVIEELNRTQADRFTLSKEEAVDGQSHCFPFSRRVYSDENDGTLNTSYTYEGEPYVLETEE